jgi:hypothetical protein
MGQVQTSINTRKGGRQSARMTTNPFKTKGRGTIPPNAPTCTVVCELPGREILAAPRYRILAKASTCTRKSGVANCGTWTVVLFGEGEPK